MVERLDSARARVETTFRAVQRRVKRFQEGPMFEISLFGRWVCCLNFMTRKGRVMAWTDRCLRSAVGLLWKFAWAR